MPRKKSDYPFKIDFDPETLARLMRLAQKSDQDEVAWIMVEPPIAGREGLLLEER